MYVGRDGEDRKSWPRSVAGSGSSFPRLATNVKLSDAAGPPVTACHWL